MIASLAFHPSRVGKWVPASAGKANAGMVHSDSGCARGVQVKLWDPLRTRVIPERLRGVITTRRYTNPRLPLPYFTPLRRSGMARVLKGSHSSTHPRSCATEWTIPAFAFPAEAGTHLPTPEGWKAELACRSACARAYLLMNENVPYHDAVLRLAKCCATEKFDAANCMLCLY